MPKTRPSSRRLFAGILIPDTLRLALAAIGQRIAATSDSAGATIPSGEHAAAPRIKLVEPENLHFTLKFLGDVPERSIKPLRAKLARMFEEARPFRIELAGVHAFPDAANPRTIWAGVGEGADQLEALMRDVQRRLSWVRKEDPGQTVPHLTLARVRAGEQEKAADQPEAGPGPATIFRGAAARGQHDALQASAAASGPGETPVVRSEAAGLPALARLLADLGSVSVGTMTVDAAQLIESRLGSAGPSYDVIAVFPFDGAKQL